MKLSMRSRGAGAYFSAAIALVAIIPVLCTVVVMLSFNSDLLPDSGALQNGAAFFGLFTMAGGYYMLRVYPRNLYRLQQLVEKLAHEELPENAALISNEQDTFLLEQLLNQLIGNLQDKIQRLDTALAQSRQMLHTIEVQSEEILAAERQRVMIESLGAACHHISQPAAVLTLYLSQLRTENPAAFDAGNLGPCLEAVAQIGDILRKLRETSEYRTVPYGASPDLVKAGEDLARVAGVHILAIGKNGGEATTSGG